MSARVTGWPTRRPHLRQLRCPVTYGHPPDGDVSELSGPGHHDGSIRLAMHPAWTALLLGHTSPNVLPRRAWPAGRLATLGAVPYL